MSPLRRSLVVVVGLGAGAAGLLAPVPTAAGSLILTLWGGLAAWSLLTWAGADQEVDPQALAEERKALESGAERLADRLELIRGVFETSAELVGCVTEDDARARFAAAMRRYWASEEAYLLLWERGAWRSLGGHAMPAPPDLTERVRLPEQEGGDLVLDLSGGVDGQAALVLRRTRLQPPLQGRPQGDLRAVAEVLAGQLSLSLRRVVLYRSLQALARLDQLTGCQRRWYGGARLAERCDQGSVVAVILLDLDHFKTINDRHGHAAGDRTLAAVGHCLVEQIRSQDLACRWGGEEFLVILPETHLAGAELVADRLRRALSQITGLPEPISASAGVAACAQDETAEALVARADEALAEAKIHGRDRRVTAPPPPGAPTRTVARGRRKSDRDLRPKSSEV